MLWLFVLKILRDLNKLLKLVSGFDKAIKYEWYKNGQLRFMYIPSIYIIYIYNSSIWTLKVILSYKKSSKIYLL